MKAKFSKSTNGIFPANGYGEFPADALDIPDSLYEKFQSAQISGFDVVDGVVVEKVIQLQTIEQIRASTQCSAWQLRRALTQMGLRDAVESAVTAADQDTKDMWEYATTYERLHPMVATMATALNKTDADIDDLFNLASTFTQ